VGFAFDYSDIFLPDQSGVEVGTVSWETSHLEYISVRFLGFPLNLPNAIRYYLDSTGSMQLNSITTVPLPAAVWLFGTGLLGLIGFSKRKKLN